MQFSAFCVAPETSKSGGKFLETFTFCRPALWKRAFWEARAHYEKHHFRHTLLSGKNLQILFQPDRFSSLKSCRGRLILQLLRSPDCNFLQSGICKASRAKLFSWVLLKSFGGFSEDLMSATCGSCLKRSNLNRFKTWRLWQTSLLLRLRLNLRVRPSHPLKPNTHIHFP